ncbi:MAG: hypothetical protein WA823_12755 [Candidatus Acidiferrales bacterium]
MIRGLDLFREHFAPVKGTFVLIGGVACHEWLATQELPFRATKDMDVVLIAEALDPAFVKRFWEFIDAGKYQARFQADDGRQLYRFDKPDNADFPKMIETFSRKPSNIDLGEGQEIVPIKFEGEAASLSAILLNDASPAALIPLKARAYLDLTERLKRGEEVKGDDIAKHRTDVFRIGGTLTAESGPELPEAIRTDLRNFLSIFTPDNKEEWVAIGAGLRTTFGGTRFAPDTLIGTIQSYFKL